MIEHFDQGLALIHFFWAERTGDWVLHVESMLGDITHIP